MWEVLPELSERVGSIRPDHDGVLFHTNHCLGRETSAREVTSALSPTTHVRYQLIDKKIGTVRTLPDAWQLLNDHENYPKSICSNLRTGSRDPSVTCGGAVGDLNSGEVDMWRGDQLYDNNFVSRRFSLSPGSNEWKSAT